MLQVVARTCLCVWNNVWMTIGLCSDVYFVILVVITS
jgi:hypothetical protein